jgi:hypothetical protein
VVEADTPEGHDIDGIASLKALETQHGILPGTLLAISPTGSVHHYFSHPGVKIKNSASEIAPGIDVRGDGGMVIAPPSIKPGGGCYRWLNGLGVAAAPSWLLDLIIQTNEKFPDHKVVVAGTKNESQNSLTREMALPDAAISTSISELALATIRKPHADTSKYVDAALHNECGAVASAVKGHRNAQLNRSAFSLGTLVGAGELTEDVVIDALFNAAIANGLVREDGKAACRATIASGLNAGVKQPRAIAGRKAFCQHDMEWLREIMRRPG